MARIFRQTYTKPVPAGSQIVTRKGRRYARFKDGRNRACTAALSQDGTQIIRESSKWYVEYRDADGAVCKVPGYTDRQATEQLAAELERKAARRQTGLIDRFAEHRRRPLAEHLSDWRDALLARGNTLKHVNHATARARAVFDGCEFHHWGDLSASRVEAYIAERRQQGLGVQTSNYYLQSIKQFCRWMVSDGRAPSSPLVHLSRRNASTDRRRHRRALEPDELRRLVEAARSGPVRNGVPGSERAVLYQLSAETGFRVGELRSLTWGSVNLDSDRPTITVDAAYSKHRREDVQPLSASTTRMLACCRESLASHGLKDPLFSNLTRWTRTADILRADLAVARETWLDEATNDSDRADREASDFLCHQNHSGRVIDFHALRHTFITNLVRGGVQPKVAQQLARHSTITLTMDQYTHVVLQETADALDVLPDVSTAGKPARQANRTSRSA